MRKRHCSPSEWGDDEKPVAEIVEFNAYGNKPRCLMCPGTTALFTGAFSGVCSGAVASVSSGAAYTTALTILGASFGMGNWYDGNMRRTIP